MSVEISVPQLGESIVEATVGRWLKHEGEQVSEGEPVVELETEKVNMEVVAPASGVLQSIAKQEGDTVGIGETLGQVGESQGAAPAPAPRQEPAPQPAAAPAAESVPAPAPAADGTTVSHAPAQESSEPGRATPLARRIADEHGVNLHAIHGSGPGGRIEKEDVNAYLASQGNGSAAATPAPLPQPPTQAQRPAAPVPSPAPMPSPAPAPSAVPAAPGVSTTPGTGRWEERVRMSRRRQTIARRLVEAQQTAAMLTTFNEVDMSAIMALRARRKDAFKEKHGVGLGFMSFFTKAVVGALKAYPRLNAEIQGNEMVLKHYYDIGIAVSTDEGLVVPVVRDADRLTFAEIERKVADLAKKARGGQLSLDDLQGGTFTITNGGIFGSMLSTPILNAPQVGILGMHKIEERPIALNGQVVIHPMMYLAVSYDHRIVDGAESVRFLVRVKELLEDPESLLLEA